jgi:hypothetical protein
VTELPDQHPPSAGPDTVPTTLAGTSEVLAPAGGTDPLMSVQPGSLFGSSAGVEDFLGADLSSNDGLDLSDD